jgi:hypothetical protein
MAKRSTTKGQTELIDFAEVKHQQRAEEDAAYIDALRWALADLLWYVHGDDREEARQIKTTAQELLDRGEELCPQTLSAERVKRPLDETECDRCARPLLVGDRVLYDLEHGTAYCCGKCAERDRAAAAKG